MVRLVVDTIVPFSLVVKRTNRKNARILRIKDANFVGGRASNLTIDG